MKVAVRKIFGNWTEGYALDKHTLRSIYLGDDQYGHAQFDTTRSEAGQALYQLKYKADYSQLPLLAVALAENIYPRFREVGLIVPMPATKARKRQPVYELADAVGKMVACPVFHDLLSRKAGGKQLKDLLTKEEKAEALMERFSVEDQIEGEGKWNVLVLDDLFDTGASLEAATTALKQYPKIARVYVATCTTK